jgi:hypothetical protein
MKWLLAVLCTLLMLSCSSDDCYDFTGDGKICCDYGYVTVRDASGKETVACKSPPPPPLSSSSSTPDYF